MPLDRLRIRQAIEKAIQRETEFSESVVGDVAFHMTDWLEDLDVYYKFCEDPDNPSSKKIHELLIRFLVHVPNHIAAASKLFLDIPVTDIFGVGATTVSEKDDG
jgi:hypothetical protein